MLPQWVKVAFGLFIAKKFGLAVILIGLPLLYFADVFILGLLAAGIHDLYFSFKNISLLATGQHGYMLPYFIGHPLLSGVQWLFKNGQGLTHADVRSIWLCLNLFLLPGIYFLKRKRKRKGANTSAYAHGLAIADNAAHGTSRWSAPEDISQLCEFGFKGLKQEQKSWPVAASAQAVAGVAEAKGREKSLSERPKYLGGIMLGELDGKIVRVIPGKSPQGMPSLSGHAAVFGGTGSGKSFSFVRNNIMCAATEGQSIVVTDPKAELSQEMINWLKRHGYEIKIFNLNSPEYSHRWNPLIECKTDAEISEMAACFVNNATLNDDNGYFIAKEIQLFEALSGLLLNCFPAEQQHLRAVMSLASWPKEELDKRFNAEYHTGKISVNIYEKWRGCSAMNFENAVSGLTAKLKVLTHQDIAGMLSQQQIDLAEVGRKKTALFCILPINSEESVLRPILSTFYLFLFKRLYDLADRQEGKVPVPVRFLLDEMANIGKIPGLSRIISTARSLGIHIQFVLQGRSQLDDVYGINEARNILANCTTLLLLGVAPGDMITAKMFSEILGKVAVRGDFESEDLTVPIASRLKLTQKSKRVVERYLMTADEIIRMAPTDCIGYLQWCYPLYMRKLGWTELPDHNEIKDLGKASVAEEAPKGAMALATPPYPEGRVDKTKAPTVATRAALDMLSAGDRRTAIAGSGYNPSGRKLNEGGVG